MKTLYMTILRTTLVLFTVLFSIQSFAQDTFSICAFDSVTGQVGSAGATCIASNLYSALIISDVHPGVGVIHTQAYWIPANQNYGKSLMDLGTLTPQQIIDSLTIHDAELDSTKRQYGVVDMNRKLTAQYTGINSDDYKSHIHGDYYSIQGNTLLGQEILDSIQSRFLNTQGTLACRLMAALQGAKVIGADHRCTQYGISTFSAFIRVANSWDTTGAFYLDLTVNTFPSVLEPIDSLQSMFDTWGGCSATYIHSPSSRAGIQVFPNPVSDLVMIHPNGLDDIDVVKVYSLLGDVVKTVQVNNQDEFSIYMNDLSPGIYFLKVQSRSGESFTSKLIKQ